ncbi:MAG: hypothetical protein K2Y18_04645 [Alphaproteobacteria bacterium]|nr:hypothetical protein [Alphaproteobacteria bacterium]
MDCFTKLKRIMGEKGALCAGLFGLGGFLLGLPGGIGEVQASFDGPYVGVHLGHLHQTTSLDAKQDPANKNADMNNTTGARGMPTVEIVLGWGRLFWGCFYGGVEGKIDWAKGGSQKVAEDVNFIYKSGRKGLGAGVLARLGYLVTPTTMVYGGVGIKSARFSHNIFEKADQISAPFSKRSHHLLTEVGIETSTEAIQNLKFRFGYSFMPKKAATHKTTEFPINHLYREQGIVKAGTLEHIIKVGMIYRF